MRKFNANTSRLRGIKIKIYPNESQKEKMALTFDIYRKVYNMAINIQNIDRSKYISYFDMCKIFSNMIKQEEYSWLSAIPLSTIRQALVDNDMAFRMFFSKKKNFPRLNLKEKLKNSFQQDLKELMHMEKIFLYQELGL